MPAWLIVLVAVVGTAHLLAYYGGRRGLAGTLKALPILALAVFAATIEPSVGARYAALVTAGLLFSAVGDVCLVWPQGFTLGLASFLVGHCCYLAAFLVDVPAGGLPWPWVGAIAIVAVALLAVLWPHLGRVRGPVLAYVAVIAAMACAAARRAGASTPEPSGVLALAGALTFMVSDSVLAIDRFAQRFTGAHAVVMVTYYGAQTLIAASVAASA